MEQMMKAQEMIINLLRSRTYIQIMFVFLLCFSIGLNAKGQSSIKVDQVTKLDVKGFVQAFSHDGKIIALRLSNSKLVQYYDLTTNKVLDSIPNENMHQTETKSVKVGSSADLNSIDIKEEGRANKTIQPLGKNDYLNVSLSPDKSKILFRVSGIASFICDLKGKIIYEMKEAEFPIWISDEQVLFARIEDDGYQYLSSDFYVKDLKNEDEVNVTESTDLIPLYPAYDIVSRTLGFSTPDGNIYLSKVN